MLTLTHTPPSNGTTFVDRGAALVDTDQIVAVAPGSPPNYNRRNPLLKLLGLVSQAHLAAEREHYDAQSLQYLFPFSHLVLYGPQGDDFLVLDPRRQDNKTDFQKQNIQDFTTTDAYLVRGWVSAGDWVGPFLKISYDGGPDSQLYRAAGGRLGDSIRVWLRIGEVLMPSTVRVPYHEDTDRYELEIWGYPGGDLEARLDVKGRSALQRGELLARPDLVRGRYDDFAREGLDDRDMFSVAPGSTMHPIRPLHVEAAWADETHTWWDSRDGANYQYEFDMILRGWNHFLKVGVSPNPHGGVGFLHYRNVLSNYGAFSGSGELGRTVEPWSFGADGTKPATPTWEPSLTVDYVDLHILQPDCGIGIHRHRDNQEVFFVVEGTGLMVVGDWEQFPQRERCFEVRTLLPGHFTLLKPGELHALMNVTTEPMSLLMFGGYD